MAKIALALEDSGPNGTVHGDTYGDVKEDTPATRLAWAAMYMMATPSLITLMMPNITMFRERRLAQDKQMEEMRSAGSTLVAVDAETDKIIPLPTAADPIER